MTYKINQKLESIEATHQVKVLYACESGSRAWGFASPDSDFDIRFIYKNQTNWYLNLWEKKDVIEFMTAENLDGSGWDLAKAIRLLAKSNVPLYEWIYSPVYYKSDIIFLEALRKLADDCFSPIAAMYHYLSMTKNYLEKSQQEQVKLKHLFYALRTALAGKWIVMHQTMPPVAFDKLLILTDNTINEQIYSLIQVKAEKGESYLHPNNRLVSAYLMELVAFNEKYAPTLAAGSLAHDKLNEFFITEINRNEWI
jgi:predicted nucleotidyltransferase